MDWYYTVGDERRGPLPEEELSSLVSNGAIGPEDLVWNETMIDWVPVRTAFAGLTPGGSVPPTLSLEQRRAVLVSVNQPLPGQRPAVDAVAICALIFGILGIVCMPLVFSLPAIICGHIARRRAREEQNVSSNGGLALAGLIMGYFGLVMGIAILGFYVVAICAAIMAETAS